MYHRNKGFKGYLDATTLNVLFKDLPILFNSTRYILPLNKAPPTYKSDSFYTLSLIIFSEIVYDAKSISKWGLLRKNNVT